MYTPQKETFRWEYLLGKFPAEKVCPYKIAPPMLVPYTVHTTWV